MSLTPRWALGGLILFLVAPVVLAVQTGEERPARHVPSKPISRKDLDRREAQRLFGVGVLHERKNRLVEAVKSFEAAGRLDPDSAAILRSLIPLYLGLDRVDDALAACKATLKLDPEDFQTAGLYAGQLRSAGQNSEAVKVLSRASRSKRLKERPDLAVQVWFDLAQVQEFSGDLAGAE